MRVLSQRIEICGNIASGKTTLCKHLYSDDCLPIYETFASNPFIDAFYSNPAKFSFETEITFLLQHYHSIKTASQKGLAVCDFSLVLDKSYADVTLSQRHRKIFIKIAQEVENELGFPQKIIHLQCPEDVLLARIRERSREFEKSITSDYLRQLTQAIEARVAETARRCEIIAVNSHKINFVQGLEGIPHIASFCQKPST